MMQQRIPHAATALAGLLLLTSTAVPLRAAPQRDIAGVPALERPSPPAIHSFGAGAVEARRPVAGDRAVDPFDDGGQGSGVTGGTRISGTSMAGDIVGFGVTPDGLTAVYIADQETAGRFELYATPVNAASAPVKISAGLGLGTGDVGVAAFEITRDGSKVVFLADPAMGGGVNDIYSVPIDGSSAPVRLSSGAEAPVSAFGITADGTRAVFFGIDTQSGTNARELYKATLGSAASAVQLSDIGAGNVNGNVTFAIPTPDGSRIVYRADATVDQRFQWYSVPTAATGPGSDIQLSAALGSVELGQLSPSGQTLVYTGDDNTPGIDEVYSVAVTGGTRTKLNPSMTGSGAVAIAISPDGARVAYLADQQTVAVVEVYSARLGVAGSGTRLNTPMSGTQSADTVNVSPDSTTALYTADQDTPGTFELFGAPIDAAGGPTMLHDLTAPDNIGYFVGLGTPIVGRRAVYPVLGASVDLYSTPFDGTAPFIRVNAPLAAGTAIFNAYVPPASSRLMAYGTGLPETGLTRRVFVGAVRGDLPVQQVNTTASSGATGVTGYLVTPNETHAVFSQDRLTAGKIELFSKRLDSDGDTVVNGDDNCPFIDNSAQGPVIFDQTVLASSATTFVWGTAREVRYVRGPLAEVASLTVNASGSLFDASWFTDVESPGPGAGFYYLFADDCAGGSYQTAPGAEPARDATLP